MKSTSKEFISRHYIISVSEDYITLTPIDNTFGYHHKFVTLEEFIDRYPISTEVDEGFVQAVDYRIWLNKYSARINLINEILEDYEKSI